MEKNKALPFQSADLQLPPEIAGSSSSKSSFVQSSNSAFSGRGMYRSHRRSKSLSNIGPKEYTAGEIRMIQERLLRMNSRLQPATVKNLSAVQKMTLMSLALVDFFCFCSMSIMAPFFPKKAAEKGLSETTSGFVFSFYALVMFVSSPVFGKILPRVGAKFLFLVGIFVAGACNLIFGLLDYIQNYTLFTIFCLLIRGFEALGSSAFSTASYVFVVNTFPNNIGAVIGILETFVGLGMSTGPVLGGFLYALGGFSLPFFALGIIMVAIVPLNMWLLPSVQDFDTVTSRKTSMLKLLKVPAVLVTGTAVVVVSSTWAFLDPTLEPHLRQFQLTSAKIGLIFLLFSGLYGISSPAWGWLADKLNNHWSMMVVGMFMSTVGLLLLGPCPFIPSFPSSLWLNLVALSILGISVALALMPTFQSVLNSAINGGCSDSIATYSVVAGIWSCMYSLGEVIGPALGGFLLQYYGFPVASSVMAASTFFMGVIAFFFYAFQSSWGENESCSDSGISASWKNSDSDESEETDPLLLSGIGSGYRSYTEEKVQYYGTSRRQDYKLGDVDFNQVTDVRGTISITARGSCEV
ncbi:MFS-type transporter SLC18B1-like [Cylas formicarius]|uniref:MFS-type transporter SLC18B1-like n=1 Tax=Cylas formicarius TaxID=197179 RepID=UPI002958928E|nr:MFS-type transporter SLC18B1-like [Cylas formicarius]XP_060517982.1 MFS-type transporter SLC18B1-like [Cylas formicarius]